MRIWIAVALAAALPVAAHAEPKTIVIDGCAKVETELRPTDTGTGSSRVATTVKCTGTADDPRVRESSGTYFYVSPDILRRWCNDNTGPAHTC